MVGRRRRRFVTKRRFFLTLRFDFLPIRFLFLFFFSSSSLFSLTALSPACIYRESETLYFSKGACDEAMIFYGPHLANRRFD
jgi:hypothetical protein